MKKLTLFIKVLTVAFATFGAAVLAGTIYSIRTARQVPQEERTASMNELLNIKKDFIEIVKS